MYTEVERNNPKEVDIVAEFQEAKHKTKRQDIRIWKGANCTSKAILTQDMERRKKLKQETRQTVFRQTKEESERLKNDAYDHKMNISDYLRYLIAKEREEMCKRTPQNDEVRE